MNIVSFLSPTNLAEEKEKFFQSDSYNPQFTYNWNKSEIDAWLSKDPEYTSFIQSILEQNGTAIKETGEQIFSTSIDSDVLDYSKELVSIVPKTFTTPPIKEVLTAFNTAFTFFGLDYKIEVSDAHGFNFRPVHKKKKIVVSKHLNLQFFSLDGEVKHELLHVVRNVNTAQASIPVSANYLPTEEGLATYFQDYVGEGGNSSLFQHAAEYAMTEVCLAGSLRETVDYLQEIGFSKDLAWQRAIRHKFGFLDTSKPGDNMKPSMYFYWQQKVKTLSDSEKLRLLSGKIRLDQLQDYKIYSGHIPEAKLIEFYKLSI